MSQRSRVLLTQVVILLALFVFWQWGFLLNSRFDLLIPDVMDPYFVSTPSEIWTQLLRAACFTDRQGQWLVTSQTAFSNCLALSNNNLWVATGVTLYNTLWGFLIGVLTGAAAGLVLGRSPFLSGVFEPFAVALNSVPRIALVPLIIMMFGIGDASKIATAWVLVFFLVFFNTFEGARQVDRDLVSVARLLHAREWQVMTKVIIPSTLTWVFASLTPAISYALIGVIVGEFVGTERGLGRLIMEAEARGESSIMMGTIFVLMVVGVILSVIVRSIQRHLLRWQTTTI
jgi:NitT/TauT family transport system permease protein